MNMKVPHPFLWILVFIFGRTVFQKLQSTSNILETIFYILVLLGFLAFVTFAISYLDDLDQKIWQKVLVYE